MWLKPLISNLNLQNWLFLTCDGREFLLHFPNFCFYRIPEHGSGDWSKFIFQNLIISEVVNFFQLHFKIKNPNI